MNCEYIVKKKEFNSNQVKSAQIFFANGDYFTLRGGEIAGVNVAFYDELRMGEEGYCPTAQGGFLKCRIRNKKAKGGLDRCLLYENPEYGKTMKEYLENRCVKEGGIRYIRLFDSNYWHLPFYCTVSAEMQGEFLILNFLPTAGYCGFESEYHTLRTRDVTVDNVEYIHLDFENCDGFDIFKDEILDMKLELAKELEWGGGAFLRRIEGGYIRLKLDKAFTWRRVNVFCGNSKSDLKMLTRRLCGKKGRGLIDICHLYVNYNHGGYGMEYNECIKVNDVCDFDAMTDEEYAKWEEECYDFISGYAEKQEDGSVLIVFGKQ